MEICIGAFLSDLGIDLRITMPTQIFIIGFGVGLHKNDHGFFFFNIHGLLSLFPGVSGSCGLTGKLREILILYRLAHNSNWKFITDTPSITLENELWLRSVR